MVQAGVSAKYAFDLQPGDVYWCTADCGAYLRLTYHPERSQSAWGQDWRSRCLRHISVAVFALAQALTNLVSQYACHALLWPNYAINLDWICQGRILGLVRDPESSSQALQLRKADACRLDHRGESWLPVDSLLPASTTPRI